MKVIFLDFDGVITIPPKWSFNDNNIKWIKKIVDETGAKLVVSSSYRSGTPPNVQDTIKKTFIRAKSPNKMIQWLIDNIYDVTSYHIDDKYLEFNNRGAEIQTWLDNHNDIESYVIIDDDSDMLDSQLYHFVQTNYEYGVGEHEAQNAIKILNNEYIFNTIGLNFVLRNEWRNKCKYFPNKYDTLEKFNDLKKTFK